MSENQMKNPAEYGYKGDETININGFQFREINRVISEILEKELISVYPEPKKWINPQTYKDATKKEIKDGVAIQITDIEKLFTSSEPDVYYTEEARKLLRIKFMLESIHAENVEKGVALHVSELRKQMSKQQPEMTLVKEEE